MPTVRGYVEKLGIGRAGLVEARVMDTNNDSAIYTIADLDADPERFNERLSKLAILRDAMDRAEPVEIEFAEADADTRPIDTVMRITRDVLRRSLDGEIVVGVIVGLGIQPQVLITATQEVTDRVAMFILSKDSLQFCQISLQIPERTTARAIYDMARDAYETGDQVSVAYDSETGEVREITRQQAQGFLGSEPQPPFSAFVEEITHTQEANLVRIDVTTAPEFQGDGNVVPLEPFVPERRVLAVIHQSPEYKLLEAALRDKLRVELMTSKQPDQNNGDDHPNDDVASERETAARLSEAIGIVGARDASLSHARAPARMPDVYMLRGVTLQHALCSATRPVWIEINRRALDVGPDEECAEGLPSNDMRPQTLRELNLPYSAAWIGYGCFNHGVYRIQIVTDRTVTVFVDGEEICLHWDEKEQAVFGHACLDGDHEVKIVFENWQCKAKFDMDMYRIR